MTSGRRSEGLIEGLCEQSSKRLSLASLDLRDDPALVLYLGPEFVEKDGLANPSEAGKNHPPICPALLSAGDDDPKTAQFRISAREFRRAPAGPR